MCHGCWQQLGAPTYTCGLAHVTIHGVWDGVQIWDKLAFSWHIWVSGPPIICLAYANKDHFTPGLPPLLCFVKGCWKGGGPDYRSWHQVPAPPPVWGV